VPFCTKCGKEIERAGVCPLCTQAKKEMGAGIPNTAAKISADLPLKKYRWLIPLVAVLFVLIVFTIFYNSANSQEKTKENFLTAVRNLDYKQVQSLLVPADYISERTVQSYVDWLHARPGELDEVRRQLAFDDYLLQRGGILFWKNYKVGIKPAFAELHSFMGSELTLVGLENGYTADPTISLGPLLPGVYTYEAELETELGPVQAAGEFEIWPERSNTIDIRSSFVMVYFNIRADEAVEGKIFLNNMDTGMSLERGSMKIGPYPPGGYAVMAKTQYPWGEFTETGVTPPGAGTFTCNLDRDAAILRPQLENIAMLLDQILSEVDGAFSTLALPDTVTERLTPGSPYAEKWRERHSTLWSGLWYNTWGDDPEPKTVAYNHELVVRPDYFAIQNDGKVEVLYVFWWDVEGEREGYLYKGQFKFVNGKWLLHDTNETYGDTEFINAEDKINIKIQ
jgi:hypothetical protein